MFLRQWTIADLHMDYHRMYEGTAIEIAISGVVQKYPDSRLPQTCNRSVHAST